jgi:protein-S-isoprenylcysteine O-methyltransferase Ste14
LYHGSIFPENWFPSRFAALVFMLLYCTWALSELQNSAWDGKNPQTINQDKGSYRIIVVTYLMLPLTIQYRIRVEEEAMQKAFGSKYEEYEKRT